MSSSSGLSPRDRLVPMEFMTRGIRSLQEGMKNKAHAKIGDAVANLIFSLAKARVSVDTGRELAVQGSPKVSARVLRDALDKARARTGVRLPVKGDEHAIADATEAILSLAWARGMIDIPTCASTVATIVVRRRPEKTADERDAFSEGFATILVDVLPGLVVWKQEA